MRKVQVLCTTMHQKDFSLLKKMNINSDVVFANQSDETRYDELEFEGGIAKMITTSTRGVGINRNLTLMYANDDVCLLADDDLEYVDGEITENNGSNDIPVVSVTTVIMRPYLDSSVSIGKTFYDYDGTRVYSYTKE